MNNMKSPLAGIVAKINEKRAAQAQENLQIGASTERANVVLLKDEEQKIQEVTKLGSKPAEREKSRPLRVKPLQSKKAEGPNDVGSPQITASKHLTEQPIIPKRQASFDKRYRRVTTYLENGVYSKVHQLYETGEIDRISNLVNTAVKLYLMKHYNYNSME
ncbi:hypothetical protein LOK74_20450 [Brevibacillus humidisoli]|uniref:hypothetical protein n=1 Tax=Brevibacillus humidisoli TaxID=2895522 RepID=UPI001E3121DE|nr:hypothetical protein [Brevibacillus humidisoli]UFJ40374.1 hypothetical protein LOK74_20450 [Brevibacillus humidisoli]